MKPCTSFLTLAICLAALVTQNAVAEEALSQDEFVRRTQELFDSVVPGDKTPWKKYWADDCMFFDEKGRQMDKAALLADITPMPPGYAGTIKVVRPKIHIDNDVAIMTYDCDETESIFGQNLT